MQVRSSSSCLLGTCAANREMTSSGPEGAEDFVCVCVWGGGDGAGVHPSVNIHIALLLGAAGYE